MDKISFSMSNKENIKFTFQKCDIEILPYIPQAVKMQILKDYAASLLGEGKVFDNYYSAEWSVILNIMEHCSNIKIDSENFDNLMSSGLWDEISSKLQNYKELRNDIDTALKYYFNKESIDNSVGKAANNFATMLAGFLEKISSMDLSKEGIDKLISLLNKEVVSFDEKFPSNGIVKRGRKKKEVSTVPSGE